MAAAYRRHGILPESFRVETTRHEGHWAVAVCGEIDLATVDTLEAELNRLSGPIVLDLSKVSFIDSLGLTVLLRATRNGLTIGEVSPAVTRLFRITGFEDVLLRPLGALG
jgi:anti-sigma B factor antagonist